MDDSAEHAPATNDHPTTGSGDSTIVGPNQLSGSRERRHASLIVVQGLEIGREYRIRRVDLTLGRDESASLRIPDERVSRQHARVVIRKGETNDYEIVIQDLGSTNGTWVNGARIPEQTLKDGDKVQVGDTVLKFQLQDDLDARFNQEIRYRIAYDQLTSLLNKESLFVALDSELRRCRKTRRPLSILMMDLDRFKSVNDTHGHLMGSLVLSEVGRLIKGNFRSTDVAARYGGEEFVAYLSEIPADEAMVAAERIRHAVDRHRFSRLMEGGSTISIHVTISIGVSEFPGHGRTREELIAAADQALYRAKDEGRNRVCRA